MRRPFLFVLSLLLTIPAAAEEINQRYRDCMALAKKTPQAAFDEALAWTGLGGGQAADHCAAAALVGLGQYEEAARRFEALAQVIKAEAPARADLLAQAAQAWLLGGDGARAEAVLDAALKLAPGDVDLHIDRAAARAQMGRYRSAVADLTQAIAKDPGRADAYVFRASAYRFLDDPARAEADVERALALDAGHAEGLLERGILRRLQGDDAGARRDWLAILTGHPGTPAADAAKANLEKMDVRK